MGNFFPIHLTRTYNWELRLAEEWDHTRPHASLVFMDGQSVIFTLLIMDGRIFLGTRYRTSIDISQIRLVARHSTVPRNQ